MKLPLGSAPSVQKVQILSIHTEFQICVSCALLIPCIFQAECKIKQWRLKAYPKWQAFRSLNPQQLDKQFVIQEEGFSVIIFLWFVQDLLAYLFAYGITT